MNSLNRKIKVCVAMSGGVDSSVTAALLKDQGYDVFGVFMRFWFDSEESIIPKGVADKNKKTFDLGKARKENRCCSLDSEYRARAVAEKLGIPFYVMDFQEEFKATVVNDFLHQELQGKTPNPCVVCNEFIKFGLLLKKALAMGADYLATGHYARVVRDQNGFFHLLRGIDIEKDQSYFLYRFNQDQLAHILFPLGEYTKEQTRRFAQKYRLPLAEDQKESQDLCFIRKDKGGFLKKQLADQVQHGPIVNLAGKRLGMHQGLIYYTVGQRKKLDIPDPKPYYVVRIDQKNNTLVVSDKEEDLLKQDLIMERIHWVSGTTPKLPLEMKAKIRYQHKPSEVSVSRSLNRKRFRVSFRYPERSITPGQAVVFYRGSDVLGGGVISE